MISRNFLQVIARKKAAKLWTPADITTAAWFDAADTDTITDSGGAVSQWDDKSGNGYDVAQGTGIYQPTTGSTTYNGLNVIDFDTSKLFNTGSLISSQPFSVAAVVSQTDANASRVQYLVNPKNNDTGLTITTQSGDEEWNVESSIFSTYECADNELVLVGAIANGASSEIRAYGDTAATGTSSGTFANGLAIGQRANDNREFYSLGGSIGEIVISAGVWDTDTRQKVEGYLAWKWGREGSLPTGHPYESHPPYA